MASKPRKRDRGGGGSTYEDPSADDNGTAYEESRKQRIKENKERLLKLGIFDLKSQLAPTTKTPRNVSTALKLPKSKPLPDSARRSSRLKSANPVNYSELSFKTKRESSNSKDLEIRIKEGSKPEIYDESHMKLLGDCKTNWTLSMDAYGTYGEDGKRIYDPEKGESCHQCRQKTLGLRTHCSSCKGVQGQFCGGCLYTRYGESVVEVNENADWVCPVCRGICNCSRCRKAQGWEPTGCIYKKVWQLGFKSVAHYLIQTRQVKTQPEDGALPISDSEERKELQLGRHDRFPDLQADKTEATMEEEEIQMCCSDATTQ